MSMEGSNLQTWYCLCDGEIISRGFVCAEVEDNSVISLKFAWNVIFLKDNNPSFQKNFKKNFITNWLLIECLLMWS